MGVILRSRAAMLAAIAAPGAACLLLAVTVLPAHRQHSAALSAATSGTASPKLGANAALPHSPQLLRKLAGSGTAAAVPKPATVPGPQGIDVASFQHPNGAAIDWTQVAAAGYKFAAVKATEGDYYTNPYFAGDITAAGAAGLYPMAYHFGIPNVSTPAQQADDFLAAVQSAVSGATPQLELDIEYDPNTGSDGANDCYNLTPSQMVSWITAFSNEIRRKAGQSPLIYSTADWWGTCTGDSTAFSAYQLWIASFGTAPTLPAAWSTWTFWQYSSTGTVSGISGNVDLSYFNDAAGTLTNPGTQTGSAGGPVWLQIRSLVGSAPFTVTGLPPGLSANPSTGLISGWLTTTGTYTTLITAATSPLPGGATTANFSWTVSAAPNSGPTGQVVLDYGGKCMDDPGYQTANGTRVDIWSCNGGANQHWTMAQDHTVRVFGKCLDVYRSGTSNGTAVDLYSCNGTGAQQWRIGLDGHLVNPHSGLCLDDPGYQITNGTRLDIWACGSGTNQRWTTPAGPIVSQIAPLCVDDTGYQTANGTQMDVWPCSGGANQSWTVEPDGTVRIFGKCLDVFHSGTANDTVVDLYSCNGSGAQQWRPRADRTLLNPESGRCLDDPGDNIQSGTKLVIFDCSAAAGEDWAIR